VHAGKGNKDRVVPIGKVALAHIDRYITDLRGLNMGGPLFYNLHSGRPLKVWHIKAIAQKYRKKLATTAERRHTFHGTQTWAKACRAGRFRKSKTHDGEPGAKRESPTGGIDRRRPKKTLATAQRDTVLELLRSDRFVDKAPHEVYATLLDEGNFYCSVRTMYRILEEQKEVRERRSQLRHPEYRKPELLATGPNQVWSWYITKLLGPVKWSYFYLYVILDIFSRYVVGWMVAHHESAALAQTLIAQTCKRQQIQAGQLTIHADRGSSMKSKSVSFLLSDLGITKTHSRPHTSNDNPYSESQFKTLKYRSDFPKRFGSL
jgi:transposase InsO family protein